MFIMETKKEIKFSGAINPEEGTARFQEKLDKQGRVQIPRVVRDKLGIHEREAIVEVMLRVEEIYPKGVHINER
jgi:hypothetical protein